MRRNEVISLLKEHERDIRAFGISHLHLYGSHARDEAGRDSDVDLFIDRDPNKKFGLFELVRLQRLLQDILKVEVDVGTRPSLHPRLKADIERGAVQVF